MSKQNKPPASLRVRLLRYLRNEASDAERNAFENDYLQNPAAKRALDYLEQSEINNTDLEKDFLEIEQRWQKTIPEQTTPTHWLGKVAIASLFILSSYLVYSYYQEQQSSRIFANYFEKGQSDRYLTVRGTNEDNPAYLTALNAYEQQDYDNSLVLFQELRNQDPFDAKVLLYTSLSAIQLGQYFTARQALDQLLSLDIDLADRSTGHWYLSLIYIHEKQFAAARTELQWLIENDMGQRGSDASKLLEEIGEEK